MPACPPTWRKASAGSRDSYTVIILPSRGGPMLTRRSTDILPSEITPQPFYARRRARK
jgi:hypothetical protein